MDGLPGGSLPGGLSPGDPDPDVPGHEPGLSYIPALDGVRAFAVVGVMAYHGGIPWLPAGFLGVDAFFVLSGFLITSLLISEWQRRRTVGLGQFWARRARRLLPALLLLLVFVVLYAAYVAPAGSYPGLRLDALSTLFYVANWHFILIGGNYFNQTGLPSLLTHTWSLAVEEQFYLLWPLVVLGVLKFTGRLWALLALSVVGALASATEMALLFRHGVDTTRLYYGTDTHGQCLLVGAALASGLALFADRRRPGVTRTDGGEAPGANPAWTARSRWARVLLSVLGGAGLVGAGLLWWRSSYNGSFLWEGGFLVAALATAAVLTCVVCVPRSWLATALSVSPLRYLGRISYGLYLWHFPLFQWIDGERTGLSGYALFGARCGATLAVATVSFHVVERPIRQGAFFRQWRAWVGAPVAVVAVSLTVVLATGSGTLAAAPAPSRGPAGPSSASKAHTTVLMLGDSTALTLSLGLSFDAGRYGARLVEKGILGCGVAVVPEDHTGRCRLPPWWRLATRRLPPPASGPPYGTGGSTSTTRPSSPSWPDGGRSAPSNGRDDGPTFSIPPIAAYVRQQLQRAVDVASSRGAAVVLFTAPCYDSGEQFDGAPWPEDQPDRLHAYNALVRQVVEANPQTATLINLDGLVCPGGTLREPDRRCHRARARRGPLPLFLRPWQSEYAGGHVGATEWVRCLDRREALAVDRRRWQQEGGPHQVGVGPASSSRSQSARRPCESPGGSICSGTRSCTTRGKPWSGQSIGIEDHSGRLSQLACRFRMRGATPDEGRRRESWAGLPGAPGGLRSQVVRPLSGTRRARASDWVATTRHATMATRAKRSMAPMANSPRRSGNAVEHPQPRGDDEEHHGRRGQPAQCHLRPQHAGAQVGPTHDLGAADGDRDHGDRAGDHPGHLGERKRRQRRRVHPVRRDGQRRGPTEGGHPSGHQTLMGPGVPARPGPSVPEVTAAHHHDAEPQRDQDHRPPESLRLPVAEGAQHGPDDRSRRARGQGGEHDHHAPSWRQRRWPSRWCRERTTANRW